ncbi:ribonucleoside-diphosphate reductase class II [Candidatus Methanoperedens nitroreducens]|uniref:Vitamin B12-dependent ribonucleotide reductase n=1 Tax=Candidatus Methanoperedens nitratireducens TaxID=1392998 RepID=A0A062V883_9EURY|nr:adenosylcobalamin-dependent ribonucleoside-diphosphate reductase [Candidatus Methanoperedens nitroreducens]KCZ72793.1 ribonucleoside-diphosphate reductase class II [Candidatus Methanoperedens nitroreducens]MDJ1423276.1 adenosylcobalamin-dependent ribonucleoside-diphosphate reductase [Candidatus Methanoperedens sp.]
MVDKIRKRDGRIVQFDKSKIANAVFKAFLATKSEDGKRAEDVANQVTEIIKKRIPGIPGVEEVQDIVEEVLIKNGYAAAAKAYILYREKRAQIRRAKQFFVVKDELKLGVNAVRVLERRYLLKDESGNVIETPLQLLQRVAKAVALDPESEEEFFEMLVRLEFLPNTPTLMNAGTDLGQLSACFVIPVEDSLVSIFDAVKHMALIQQSGGGTGFSFTHLRPKGDIVRSTKGVASGPVSFMRVFDTTTDVIKQGGKRRGANMGILRADHPDVVEFSTAKSKEGFLTNFNISVAVDDRFMKAVVEDGEYELINPRNMEVVKKARARDMWDLIITMAWRTGDPGVVFIDEVNRYNPTPQVGQIESTNPCGEQPLLPYESCNLGSINLAKMVKDGSIDWEKLEKIIPIAVKFLDNVVDVNKYPLREIEEITKANRKIGLGVMGFADMLVQLGIPYNSEDALKKGEEIMRFIQEKSHAASERLAQERGAFPNFPGSIFKTPIRNSTVTTVAPTGTISIIAGCSSGIEPLFAVSFVRNVLEGTRLVEVNPYFEAVAKERGFYSEGLMMNIAKQGTLAGIEGIPDDVKRVFVTAFDIAPEWHVRMQAAFQKYTDNAVSKTINFPHDVDIKEVEKAYMLAYELKCKGITVYRYGSKIEQVLYLGDRIDKYVSADTEYAGGCPAPVCPT